MAYCLISPSVSGFFPSEHFKSLQWTRWDEKPFATLLPLLGTSLKMNSNFGTGSHWTVLQCALMILKWTPLHVSVNYGIFLVFDLALSFFPVAVFLNMLLYVCHYQSGSRVSWRGGFHSHRDTSEHITVQWNLIIQRLRSLSTLFFIVSANDHSSQPFSQSCCYKYFSRIDAEFSLSSPCI